MRRLISEISELPELRIEARPAYVAFAKGDAAVCVKIRHAAPGMAFAHPA